MVAVRKYILFNSSIRFSNLCIHKINIIKSVSGKRESRSWKIHKAYAPSHIYLKKKIKFSFATGSRMQLIKK
jgi:hypothetical protein